MRSPIRVAITLTIRSPIAMVSGASTIEDRSSCRKSTDTSSSSQTKLSSRRDEGAFPGPACRVSPPFMVGHVTLCAFEASNVRLCR
jgi:hypothetical protein